MGILIKVVDGAVSLTLECDGESHLFPAKQSFIHKDGFIGQYRLAMAAGWKDTCDSHGTRVFLGPCCSGK